MRSPRKYFVAIVLPEPCLSKVEAIKHDLYEQYGLKGALRCPAHITLHRPFVWDEHKEEHLIHTLKDFKGGAPFGIHLHNFNFFAPRVVYVDLKAQPELEAFHKKLVKHIKQNLRVFNEADDLRGFHPHVTVASRDLKKKEFNLLQERFSHAPFDGHFVAEAFSLLKLGARWQVLEDFPIYNHSK